MSKADFNIVNGIREGDKTYVPGMESELAEVLPAARLNELIDSGDLRGSKFEEPADIARENAIAADSGEVNEFTAAVGATPEGEAPAPAKAKGGAKAK